MKIWLLKRIEIEDEQNHYEETYGFVIRAEDENSARELATAKAGYETIKQPEFWRNESFSSCSELRAEGEPGVVLRDFFSG